MSKSHYGALDISADVGSEVFSKSRGASLDISADVMTTENFSNSRNVSIDVSLGTVSKPHGVVANVLQHGRCPLDEVSMTLVSG